MTGKDWRNLSLSAALLALAALLPIYGSPYWLTMGTTIAMFAVLATSWALFSGPTHYISLATAAFFGVGTFVTGLWFQVLPFWALPLIAAGVGAVLAGLVGFQVVTAKQLPLRIFGDEGLGRQLDPDPESLLWEVGGHSHGGEGFRA